MVSAKCCASKGNEAVRPTHGIRDVMEWDGMVDVLDLGFSLCRAGSSELSLMKDRVDCHNTAV